MTRTPIDQDKSSKTADISLPPAYPVTARAVAETALVSALGVVFALIAIYLPFSSFFGFALAGTLRDFRRVRVKTANQAGL